MTFPKFAKTQLKSLISNREKVRNYNANKKKQQYSKQFGFFPLYARSGYIVPVIELATPILPFLRIFQYFIR
jgi:hypothetical protein